MDKMLNDLLAFGPDFLFLYFSIFFCLNFMPYVLCNGEECLLPCNVVRCVVVRTDKTEYMVMQVRGWGQELVILLPGKIIQMQYSATYLFLLKVQKIGRHFV